MMRSLISHVLLSAAALTFGLSRYGLGQGVVLGILEDNPGWHAGDPNFRDVRVVFEKVGADWRAFKSDCRNEECLKADARNYPPETTWTIAFDGKSLGEVVGSTPDEFRWYAAVGQQKIISTTAVPTVGKPSAEFGGFVGAAVYRPLVANSQPYFKDPESWRPSNPSEDLAATIRHAFRERFPKLCRSSQGDESKLEPFPYRDGDVTVVKAYSSKLGWAVVRLHLEAIDCQDTEAGFDIDDPWFVVDPRGSVTYLDAGMWLVDAGDYDNDGRSELVFSIDRDDRGGYELFYDNFRKHAAFEFSYH
jgi:hypothetical protein